jgi:hypothetical protein
MLRPLFPLITFYSQKLLRKNSENWQNDIVCDIILPIGDMRGQLI